MKRHSLPIFACIFAVVAISATAGHAESAADGTPDAPQSAPAPGLRAHIDPSTGASAGLPEEGAAFPSTASRRRAVTQADAASSPVAGGGVLIDVSGLFMTGMVADGAGQASAGCLDGVEE